MILLICVANRCQAPHYEDLVTSLLKLPYLCIAKCHLSGRTRIVLSIHADETSTIGAVLELRDVQLIHIQIESTSMSNDGYQVRLIQASLEAQGVTNCCILRSTSQRERDSVPTNCRKIDKIICAEDNSASVPFENRHLQLKGKVTEIAALRETVDEVRRPDVIGSTSEETTVVLIPGVFVLIIQRIVNYWASI